MNLDLDPTAVAFRDEVRSWLAANVVRLPAVDAAADAHREWERRLADARLSVVSWPVEYGGRAAPPLHTLLFEEEYHAARAPARIGQNGLFPLHATGVTVRPIRQLSGEAGPVEWRRLGEVGVTGLAVPSRWGGAGGTPADLVIAAEELGHHAVGGPVAETLAAVPALIAGSGDEQLCGKWLPELAGGRIRAALTAPPWLPFAAPADLVLDVRGSRASVAGHGLSWPAPEHALDLGALVCAAQLLGAGRALLEAAVAYAKERTQFGRPIGSFQALRHRLADVAVGLQFARPALYAAAVTLAARDVSAAKVLCGQAAARAARAALQVHGAIGYTQEFGLGRWLTQVRALTRAWGTAGGHRARVLA